MIDPRTEHPDEITTASYLDGGLAGRRLADFEAHVAVCDDCRCGIALLGAAENGVEPLPGEFLDRLRANAPRPRSHRRRRWRSWAAAIVAGLGLAGGFSLLPDRIPRNVAAEEQPVYRDLPQPAVFGEIEPGAGEAVSTARVVFRWSTVEAADRYEIEVLGPDGALLGSLLARAGDTSVAWPPDRPELPVGVVLWKIRALQLDRVVAETRPVPFEVR